MNLGPTIQSEVSQNKKVILLYSSTYIWNLENSTEEFIYRRAIEKETENRLMDREQTYEHGERGGEGQMYGESNMETYITICKIDS